MKTSFLLMAQYDGQGERSTVVNRVRNLPTHEEFILKNCVSDDLIKAPRPSLMVA